MKSGPDVFADALVPSGHTRPLGAYSFPGTLLFRWPASSGARPLIFPHPLILSGPHRRPCRMLFFAGSRQRRLSKGGSLNTRRRQAYTAPWSVSVEKTLARLR